MKKTVKVNKVESVKAGKTDRIVLHYEVLDGPKKGEVWKIGALKVKLDESSRNSLKGAEGDLRDITIEKDGNYWNLMKVESVGSAPAQAPRSSGGSSNTTYKAASKPFDDVGIKVGAARNQAIAYLSATKGKSFTLDDVDATAYEIVERQSAQEATVRAGNNPAKPEALAEQATQQYDDSEVSDEFGF